jgi:hypothetical protein
VNKIDAAMALAMAVGAAASYQGKPAGEIYRDGREIRML